MKILIQCNYDPRSVGGIEAVTRNLLDVLSNRDYEVTVIAAASESRREPREIYKFLGLKMLFKVRGAPVLHFGNWYFFRAGLRADVILFQEPFPTLLPALFLLRFLFRKRVVVLVHAIPAMPRVVSKLYDGIRRMILGRVSVVATTPVLLEQLKLTPHSQHARDVISLCVKRDFPDLKPSTTAHNFELAPVLPSRYMLFLGRLANYKGIEVLLHAIREVPDVQFVISGAGQLSGDVRDHIEKHALRNVSFINRQVSDAEKYYLLAFCEAFILPSTTSSEAFAITQVEAMHFAKPIINTQLKNGVNFVAPANEVALTVPPGDSVALAAAIRRMWDEESLRRYLGCNGKRRKEALFSWNVFHRKWLAYFDRISSSL